MSDNSETKAPFIPVTGQSFATHSEWVRKAEYVLTAHPDYHNTEHGAAIGWRGDHFTAMCFDQQGRRLRNGGDFSQAEKDCAFPVWWIWPDQIVPLLTGEASQ